MSKEFTDLVKQEVKERLPNWIGQLRYPCDLGNYLTENENSNGSWFCSRHEAREFIKNFFEDFEEYQSWYRCNFGEPEWFESEPDDYHHDVENVQCRMMIFAVEQCFGQAFNIAFENDKNVSRNLWNEKVEITQDFCDKIIKALEEVEEIW
jgi:hypothetical protein